MRYEITVKSGRKIVERKSLNDYSSAMDMMDELETRYGEKYIVEFRDTNPFGR